LALVEPERPVIRQESEMAAYKETLRSLALNDEHFVESVLGIGRDTVAVSQLDQKTHALVRLGAALAIDAAPSSYQATVDVALAAGADIDEVVGTLIAVAPTIGLARVVSAAPELALALGYDVDAAFEATDENEQRSGRVGTDHDRDRGLTSG
jgi:alkylhydroperoxidase/carboxymuconolactone decarboxylase family protein YurZ